MFLNLIAPINPLGYGVVGLNILKSLIDSGHNISYFPIGQPQWEAGSDILEIIQMASKNSEYFNYSAPSIRIWHQHDLAMFPGFGERIGWPIFELNKFDDKEKHHLNSVDRLFVCSQWAKDIVEQNGLGTPTSVIPLGVDTSVFYANDDEAKKRPYYTKESTVFINVGKWEIRKGHYELLDAFNNAFEPEDNVELWMLNHNPFIGVENEKWKREYIASPLGSKIKILPRVNNQADLRKIYNQVDFGVFPSHAEGWNLEVLELMACGKPSVATNYSGHTEFLDSNCSLLVEQNGIEDAHDGKWFNGQGQWCTFDIDELIEQMRLAHTMKQSGKMELMTQNCLSVADKFSWENSVRAIEDALSDGNEH